jgi:hypothetical protein
VNTDATDPTHSENDDSRLSGGLGMVNGSDPKDPTSWTYPGDCDAHPMAILTEKAMPVS